MGIGSVMIASALPGDWSFRTTLALEGREYTKEGEGSYPRANYIVVTENTLEKLGVELKQGRYFNSSDEGSDKKTVIVTDSFVTSHFANESPLGKRLRINDAKNSTPDWLTIVGVVKHTVQGDVNNDSGKMPSVFRPFAQAPRKEIIIAMKMKADITLVTQSLRKTLESIDSDLPAYRIETYTDKFAHANAPIKWMTDLFLLFGLAAVVLAASGIYGVMSNVIHQRTQEMGVKRALGAMDHQISKEFLMAGFKQLLWGGIPGVLVGCSMGFAIAKSMGTSDAALLFVAIIMVTVIASVVMFATWLPTQRALQMEPSEALHYQ